MSRVEVARINAKLEGYGIVVNTTSRSPNQQHRQLSPFYLGPCELYGGYSSKNMENAWQFAKVYREHADENGDPTEDYWRWAENGWNDSRAHRYPMGKGKVPMYSLWKGRKLDYIEARKEIYIPLYAKAVLKTEAYRVLKSTYESGQTIALKDFDGYYRKDKSWEEVINDPSRKMGHAFVLAMLLEGYIKL